MLKKYVFKCFFKYHTRHPSSVNDIIRFIIITEYRLCDRRLTVTIYMYTYRTDRITHYDYVLQF